MKLLQIGTGLVLIALVGCSAPQAQVTPTSSTKAVVSAELLAQADALIVQLLNGRSATTQMPATPSAVNDDGKPQMFVLEDDSEHKPGSYSFHFACVGHGQLDILVETAKEKKNESQACAPDGVGRSFVLKLSETQARMKVVIQPSAETVAAIAYSMAPGE